MELDKNDLSQANRAKTKEESKDAEAHNNGTDKQTKYASTFCQECNTHHSVTETLSG